MAYTDRDWEELGRNIRDIVDQAVNRQDYQKLNQTIRQTVERAVDLGGEAVRKAVDGRNRAESAGYRQPQPVAETKDLSILYGKTGNLTAKGLAKTICGGVLTAFTGITALTAMILSFAGIHIMAPVLSLAGLGGGIGLMASGIRNLNQVSRFKIYRRTLGQKTHCALEKLARGVGKSVKFVRKELNGMIDQGLFLEGHLDKEETMLITSHETYRLFESSRLQLEQRQREQAMEAAKQAVPARDERVQEVLDKGNAFISEIRRCNDAIPGYEISAKIDGLEAIVRRIFDRARTNPEIVPDLKKMMDYYLPMTVKLLNAYADMDAQPVQGENIQNSKREIEDTLDTLNLAFEKLLDNLFADTALDVSSDISVLQTMLAQEGLTDDGLRQIRNQP
jgi:hypothetical protein